MSGVTTRPVAEADEDFLRRVYAEVRADDIGAAGWSPEQVAAFVDMQYRARSAARTSDYPDAEHLIVRSDGEDVGELLVDRSCEHIVLVDIALLRTHRNRGIGGELISRLADEADAHDRCVVLHVIEGNQAARLYERAGFAAAGGDGMHVRMVREPKAVRA